MGISLLGESRENSLLFRGLMFLSIEKSNNVFIGINEFEILYIIETICFAINLEINLRKRGSKILKNLIKKMYHSVFIQQFISI